MPPRITKAMKTMIEKHDEIMDLIEAGKTAQQIADLMDFSVIFFNKRARERYPSEVFKKIQINGKNRMKYKNPKSS